jgi:glycosyltransferase involved in cell wall biosynthesis
MSSVRITIDASHTARSGKNTGIERVVRNLCRNIQAVASGRGLAESQIATHINGHFFPLDSVQRTGFNRLARWEADAQSFVPKWLQALPLCIADRWPTEKLKRWACPSPSHLGGYKIPHMIYSRAISLGRYIRGGALIPNAGELLILPDYWNTPEIWQTISRYRQADAFVATVIYDLIPLTHPQYVGKKRRQKFRSYLEGAVRNSDLIIAISKTVRDDVVQFIDGEIESSTQAVCQDIRSFTLGAEIGYEHGTVRPEIESLFSDAQRNTPYLMVGSFDPRKNHQQALDAFEQLWQGNSSLKLCMFGRTGSMCEGVIQRIRNHPMLNRGLFVFHDANDAELLHAYQYASGVLLPSIVEGFGLPIVESLWHGKRTFVSDTPIHREVGGDLCDFFELGNPQSLAEAIIAWESERERIGTRNPNTQRSRTTSWDESASQFLDLCLDAYSARRGNKRRQAA